MHEKLDWRHIQFNRNSGKFESEGQAIFETKYQDALKFHAPGVAPVRDESGWYHINLMGWPIYNQRYKRCFGFYEEKAAVEKSDGWTHVDLTGGELGGSYQWVGNFQEGRCVVRDFIRQYFHLDHNGHPAYSGRYRYAGDFRDGIACVYTEFGWTHINLMGEMTHNRYFKGLNVFHKGYALALDAKGWFHIDEEGEAIYTHRFRMVEPFYNGQALAQEQNGQWVLLDREGQVSGMDDQ